MFLWIHYTHTYTFTYRYINPWYLKAFHKHWAFPHIRARQHKLTAPMRIGHKNEKRFRQNGTLQSDWPVSRNFRPRGFLSAKEARCEESEALNAMIWIWILLKKIAIRFNSPNRSNGVWWSRALFSFFRIIIQSLMSGLRVSLRSPAHCNCSPELESTYMRRDYIEGESENML